MLTIVINALLQVESGGNWSARNGDCWGGLQISSVMVKDINQFAGTHYEHQDACIPTRATMMAILYLEHYATRDLLGYDPTYRDYAGIWRHGLRGYKRGLNLDADYIERAVNLMEIQSNAAQRK